MLLYAYGWRKIIKTKFSQATLGVLRISYLSPTYFRYHICVHIKAHMRVIEVNQKTL